MNLELTAVIAIVATCCGAAVAWGTVRASVRSNTDSFGSMRRELDIITGRGSQNAEPVFVRRVECNEIKKQIQENEKRMYALIHEQDEALRRIHNFSLWYLTVKEGLPLDQAKRVLENGKQ